MSEQRRIIIAIDGPAGSGKSSTAREVAARLGYRHLDSGAFYRALTLAVLQTGIDPDRWDELGEEALSGLAVSAHATDTGYRLTVGETDVTAALRTPEVNAHVSRVAALASVREWLLDRLRSAGRERGLVADGRDIGSVVFQQAELKVFLVCSPEERARRRLVEHGNPRPSRDEVRAEATRLLDRDKLDSTREHAPLLRAPDAVLLDTTELAFEAQVAVIVRLAEQRITSAG